jgi:hypothetical protein
MAKKTNITIAVTEKELAALNYCAREFILLAQDNLDKLQPLKNKHLKRANKVRKQLLEQYKMNQENETNQHPN